MRDRNKMIRGKMMSVRISRLAARVVVLLGLVRLLLISPALAADAEHGKALFAPCAACHTERTDALGPDLKGVFGRKSAAIEDFRYSNAMKRANLVWDEDNLRAYIHDPQAKVKGNRMPYGGMNDPKDVDDVVAYLKTLK
jgi:cytochrome c